MSLTRRPSRSWGMIKGCHLRRRTGGRFSSPESSGQAQLGGQPDALELAGRAFGDLGQEQYLARDLEVGQATGREVAHLLLRQAGPLAQYHGGGHLLAQLGVGD